MTAHTTTSSHPAKIERWTGASIMLHWLIVVGILWQWLASADAMAGLFNASRRGEAVGTFDYLFGYSHIIVGTGILVAAAARLYDRWSNGRPERGANVPNWAETVAKVTHFLLYALLIVHPILGLAAWFLGNEQLAELHELGWNGFKVLVPLHIIGALANHFYYKNNVLKRIMPGQGRTAP